MPSGEVDICEPIITKIAASGAQHTVFQYPVSEPGCGWVDLAVHVMPSVEVMTLLVPAVVATATKIAVSGDQHTDSHA